MSTRKRVARKRKRERSRIRRQARIAAVKDRLRSRPGWRLGEDRLGQATLIADAYADWIERDWMCRAGQHVAPSAKAVD